MALQLGRTPRELELSMTAREYAEMQAMYNLQPWGEERSDLRAGIIAAMVGNAANMLSLTTIAAAGGKADGETKTFHPTDFMPKFGEQITETPSDKISKIKRLHEELRTMKEKS